VSTVIVESVVTTFELYLYLLKDSDSHVLLLKITIVISFDPFTLFHLLFDSKGQEKMKVKPS